MNFQNVFNQFTGSAANSTSKQHKTQSSGLGSGLLGGVAAGGVMGLLVSNKKARKFAGKAATVGGAALIGGIAFKAYKSWQQNNSSPSQQRVSSYTNASSKFANSETTPADMSQDFQLTLIKAMIGAAKSDGHIDDVEQKRIFNSIEQMSLSHEMKGLVFDLIRQPIFVEEIAHGAQSMEQKSEVYLASCLAIDLDSAAEFDYLNKLAGALSLPMDLAEQIRQQAKQALDSEKVLN